MKRVYDVGADANDRDHAVSTPSTRPVPLAMELTEEDFEFAGKETEESENDHRKEISEGRKGGKVKGKQKETSQEKQDGIHVQIKQAALNVEMTSTCTPATHDTQNSCVPPTIFQKIATKDTLVRAMQLMDLEVKCDALSMPVIQSGDFHEYDSTQHVYKWLYGLMQDGGSVGERHGNFYSWHDSNCSSELDNPVVYLGPKGEKAKVGRTTQEFLQVALSLYPYFMNAIGFLPAVKLKENVLRADESDFRLAQRTITIKGYLEQDRARDLKGLRETTTTADNVLEELELTRLSIHDALETLVEAHLAHPRFAIRLKKPIQKPRSKRIRKRSLVE
eukprot:m.14866 g.14866  ORF g.14866 m.14866 type:complete len:334 (+) comp10322_c0_seq1:281-1282(+)